MVLVFIIANLFITTIMTTATCWACVVVGGCEYILKENAGVLSRILKPKTSLFEIMFS